MLELVDLPVAYRKRYPRQLSGGEQQRVGVARALAADPPIVLMDEPFGAIDAINRVRLQDELLRIQPKLHKTILFVTHDVEEAFKLGDRIVVMREGRIVQAGTPLELATAPKRRLRARPDRRRRHGAAAGHAAGVGRAAAAAVVNSCFASLPTISQTSDLRAALALLLRSGAAALTVVDAAGEPLGRLDFAGIRRVLDIPS